MFIRIVRRYAGWLMVLALLVGLLGVAAAYKVRMFYIDNGSMRPTLGLHELVVTARTNNYQRNDIITFHARQGITTHRVYEVNPDGTYLTKGDFNDDRDPGTLPANRIVGEEIIHVPYIGAWLDPYFWAWRARQPGFWGSVMLLLAAAAVYVLFVREPRVRDDQEVTTNDPAAKAAI